MLNEICGYCGRYESVISGSLSPRHTRPQVSDGRTASNMEDSCGYIE